MPGSNSGEWSLVLKWLRVPNCSSWPWYRLFSRLKPMLKGMKSNAEIEALERKCKELEENHKREEEARKKYADELRYGSKNLR